MDSSTPPLLQLPFEILCCILAFAVPFENPVEWGYFPPDRTLDNSPFHAVRSTCRKFRRIVDKLLAWSDDDVDIATMSGLQWFYLRNNTPMPQYLDLLLSDPHLKECLSRKTGWCVDRAIIFRLLKQHIPRFGQCVRYLKLRTRDIVSGEETGAGNDIPPALRDTFPILTVLDLESMVSHVHLNSLPPTLRKLVLDAHYASDDNCDCTNTLAHLEQLSFQNDTWEPLSFKKMLPFHSKETLHDFRFQAPCVYRPQDLDIIPDLFPDFALLYQFKNLTTLHTTGYMGQSAGSGDAPPELYSEHLLKSPFRLKSFETLAPGLGHFPIEALVELLESPVLHQLQNLGITFGAISKIDIGERPTYEPFVITIANLPDLEKLRLLNFLMHPDWIQSFRNSPRLKSIHWRYSSFVPIDTVGVYNIFALEFGLAQILTQSQVGDGVPQVRFDCEDYGRYYQDWRRRGEDKEEDFDEEDDDDGFEDEEPYDILEYVVLPPPPGPIV
jgi:hypothetical protein